MKVVLVTSGATYVKDNYLSLIKELTDREKLPADIEIAALVIIKTASIKLFFKMIGLMFMGVFSLSTTLIKNMYSSLFCDTRQKHCTALNIPIFQFNNINSPEALAAIKELNPDLIINVRTRNIYKKDILALPSIGCINVHHGILPVNRGTMCDLWAWYEGRPVGFSVHWMNEKIDDGNIIQVKEIDAQGINNYIDIPMKSSLVEAETIIECLEKIKVEGKNAGFSNKCEKVNYTRNPDYKTIRQIKAKGLKL